MRAITASGIVPSAIVGRMQVRQRRAEGARVAAAQRIDQHEAGRRRHVELDGDAPRHRRPAELHREEQDQQQRPPEDRHRIAGERDAHHRVVGDGVALERREDAGRQADARRRTASRRTRARPSPETASGIRAAPARAWSARCRDRRAAPGRRSRRIAPAAAGRDRTRAAAASRRAGSMPRSPDRFSTGSPGIRWISANASSVTPMNVGMISAARRRMKVSIDAVRLRRGSEARAARASHRRTRPVRAGRVRTDALTARCRGRRRRW